MVFDLIVLAAGFSRRYGTNKLLELLDGKPMYLHTADRLEALLKKREDIRSLTIVTRYAEIREEMKFRGIHTAWNDHSEQGISSSIQVGIQAVKERKKSSEAGGEERAYCFFVGDQPFLEKDTVDTFLDEFKKSGKGIGCLRSGGHAGNPAVFSLKYEKELMELSGDRGGKQVLMKYLDDVYVMNVSKEQELEDIDYSRTL